MSFDWGGFLGSIVGIFGAYGIAKWQFEKQTEEDIKLSKEMYIRTKFIEDIDKYIESNEKLQNFIAMEYLPYLISINSSDDIKYIFNDYYNLNYKFIDLFKDETLKRNIFISIDELDESVISILGFNDTIIKITKTYNRIKLNFEENKINELQDDLYKLNKKAYKLLDMANAYKIYLLQRMTIVNDKESILNNIKLSKILIEESEEQF